MQPFTTFSAVGVPIDDRNVDTNQLCPTRFNKVPEDDPNYARILFNNQRFAPDGSVLPDFILNRAPYDRAGIMVADDNFGCGSSRQISEKQNLGSEIFAENFFLRCKTERRELSETCLAKICANPSHVPGVTRNFHLPTGPNQLFPRPHIN